jgi:O-antigen/teichoic acid export membrane protein
MPWPSLSRAERPGSAEMAISIFRRNIQWQAFGSIAQALLGCGILVMIGRALGAQQFGVFSIINGLVSVGLATTELRLQDVAARQFSRTGQGDGQTAYFIDFFILDVIAKMSVCLLLAFGVGLMVRGNLIPRDAAGLMAIAALGAPFGKSGALLTTGTLRAWGRSDVFIVYMLLELLARALATAALFVSGHLTILNCVVIQSVTGAVFNVAQGLACARRFPDLRAAIAGWRVTPAIRRLRTNVRLMSANVAMSVSDLMVKDLDVVLLAGLLPIGDIGVYKMAKNIVTLVWRAVDPFTLSLMPEISRVISEKDFAGLRTIQRRSTVGLFFMIIVASSLVWVGLHLFGVPVLGPSYGRVSAILPVMLLGVTISAPLVWGHPLVVALDRPELALFGSALGMALGLPALALLTPTMGLWGASGAWLLSFSSHFVYCAWAGGRALSRIDGSGGAA